MPGSTRIKRFSAQLGLADWRHIRSEVDAVKGSSYCSLCQRRKGRDLKRGVEQVSPCRPPGPRPRSSIEAWGSSSDPRPGLARTAGRAWGGVTHSGDRGKDSRVPCKAHFDFWGKWRQHRGGWDASSAPSKPKNCGAGQGRRRIRLDSITASRIEETRLLEG